MSHTRVITLVVVLAACHGESAAPDAAEAPSRSPPTSYAPEASTTASAGPTVGCKSARDCPAGACRYSAGCSETSGKCGPNVAPCVVANPYCGCDGTTFYSCPDPARPFAHAAACPSAEAAATAPNAMTALGPLRIDLLRATPATELPHLVRLALGSSSRRCWIVWGDYRPTRDARALAFDAPDAGPISTASTWVTCPSPDDADFVDHFGDARVKLVGMAYFRDDHFEYKASLTTEGRNTGVLIVTPQGGPAIDMLARMNDVVRSCVFAYLPVK